MLSRDFWVDVPRDILYFGYSLIFHWPLFDLYSLVLPTVKSVQSHLGVL